MIYVFEGIPLRINPNKVKQSWTTMNMNTYRNLCFHANNNCKRAFKDQNSNQIVATFAGKRLEQVYIHYMIYRVSEVKFDIMNFVPMLDKYFEDALKACGVIEDDNYTVVKFISSSLYPVKRIAPYHYMNIYISDKPMFVPTEELVAKLIETNEDVQ